jgi:hypothetical protein
VRGTSPPRAARVSGRAKHALLDVPRQARPEFGTPAAAARQLHSLSLR